MQTRREALAAAVALAASGAQTAQSSTPAITGGVHDWDFLVGSWTVRHRKLRARLAGSDAWDSFGGTLVNWPLLGGAGNVGDNVFETPQGVRRGIGFRAFDRATSQWCVWWLPEGATEIAPPVRGGFQNGMGVFMSDDTFNDRPIKVRVLWSEIAPNAARWEQAFSPDGGETWEVNWVSTFARRGA